MVMIGLGLHIGATAWMAGGADAKIYGVSWDKSSDPTLTRTDDAVGMVANAGVDGSTPQNDFDAAEIYSEITEVVDGLGNTFVRIPKFYIKKTDGVGSKTWQISKDPISGGYLPWCFYNFSTSGSYSYIDIGKYTATKDGSSRLESKVNLYPLINDNIVNFRTYAENNGAGYQQLDIHVIDVLQTLFYVEFATLNSQSIMAGFTTGQYSAAHTLTADTSPAGNSLVVSNATGANYEIGQAISVGTSLGGNQRFYGRTITNIQVDTPGAGSTTITFDGAAVEMFIGDILYNTGWKNGWSSAVAASSGSIGSNSSGKFPCMYRGIESPWGNVWQFVDGVNINENQAWVCQDADDYASNLFASPYLQLGYVNHNANGYVSEMGFDAADPFAALPTAISGGATTYYSDYYYQNAGQRIARLGGVWSYGTVAGLSCWLLSGTSSGADVTVGGRLLKKAL